MAWLAVDEDKKEYIYLEKPKRHEIQWRPVEWEHFISLPYGSIEILTGKSIGWKDEPIKI